MTCCLFFFCGLSLVLLSFVTQTGGTLKIFRGVLPTLYLSQILLKLGKVLMLCVFKNAYNSGEINGIKSSKVDTVFRSKLLNKLKYVGFV